jgi:hypothetical protein
MIAIPCILYVEEDLAAAAVRANEMDKIEFRKGAPFIMPDLDRARYPVGNYDTPEGKTRYRVDVNLEYVDPKEREVDDAAPGDYPLEVLAKNSFEAASLALDRFHETHPIGNLGAVDITTVVKRVL